MAQKCVHKGCGKTFTDPEDECTYHPGPPVFHEGTKGWKCCKPRVLTFDEFMTIPPCTTGKHSTVDDTPSEPPKPKEDIPIAAPQPTSASNPGRLAVQPRAPQAPVSPAPSPAPPESESDDPEATVPEGATCRRKRCEEKFHAGADRSKEQCVHHPGQPLFHEGSKGWTCCKKRVLDFDEFMKLEGCKTKARHLFLGRNKGAESSVEKLETVRNDFYQTPESLIVSFYLKKIEKDNAKVAFPTDRTLELDLPTSDKKHFVSSIPLYGPIDVERSTFKIMGTKLELILIKADGSSWPVLRSDDRVTGEIIQVGKAGRA